MAATTTTTTTTITTPCGGELQASSTAVSAATLQQ